MNSSVDRGGIVIGILLMVAGVLFLLESLDVITLGPAVIWPLIVIGFGIAIAFGGKWGRDEDDPGANPTPPGLDYPVS